jgi:Domain of unknown function (DUF4279)
MTTPFIICEFRLTGLDLDPAVITARLNIDPSRSWRRGDTVGGKSLIRHDYNGWALRHDGRSIRLNDYLESLVKILLPYSATIRLLQSEFACDAEFACTIYFDDVAPQITLKPALVEAIGSLDAGLDIDIYKARYTESKHMREPHCR